MTIFSDLLENFSDDFDNKTYPTNVYFYLLKKIKLANSPEELGVALSHMLAWKDGKVRLSNSGSELMEITGLRYSISSPKPNTLNQNHIDVLKSNDFFNWAKKVQDHNSFDNKLITELNKKFNLWATIVIPAFLLHCLNSRHYPILDRWVLNSYAFFKNDPNKNLNATLDNYIGYQIWWKQVLIEVYPDSFILTDEQLKAVDASLWALGKHLYSLQGNLGRYLSDVGDLDELPIKATSTPITVGTDSDIFKRRAVELSKLFNQRNAIKQAAEEFGIDLSCKPSYLQYPGSHFDRWRKQGFV